MLPSSNMIFSEPSGWYTYPFGAKLNPVVQTDRSPKQLFVLGVYASAVHARWFGPDGRIRVRALAVASEPYIFWRGDNPNAVIDHIDIPSQCGFLRPADARLNGPSGTVLDEQYLAPLGYSRGDACCVISCPKHG